MGKMRSDTISHFHALKATLLMKQGLVLDRWSKDLSVIIEKLFGCTLVLMVHSVDGGGFQFLKQGDLWL